MVPQIQNRIPFAGMLRRGARVLMLGMLLFGLRATGYGQIPANWDVTVTMVQNSQPADGVSQDIVQVTITDTSVSPATPVNGVTVDFSISPTTVTSALVTGSGGFPPGTVQYGLSSTIVQAATIDIKINGVSFPAQIFRFVPGPPVLNPPPGSPDPSYFIVTGNDAAADGVDTNGIQVHVTDANGNQYPQGTPVRITITSGTPASADVGFRPPPGFVTTIYNSAIGPNGTVDLPMVDGIAGNVTMTASVEDVNNGNTWYTFPNPVTVTWLSPTVDPASSLYTTVIASASADGADTAVVQVHLVAPGGGPVPGNTVVYFTVTSSGPASTNAMLNRTTTTNFSEPIGNVNVTGNTIDLPITDLQSGSVTITASVMVGGVLTPINGSPQTVTFTAGPPAINQPTNPSYFTTVTNNQAADGASQDVVKVFLSDANGNAVANFPVTFTITSNNAASTAALFDPPPGGTPTPTTVTVNTTLNSDPSGPGYITLPLTDLQTGNVTITATFTVGGTTYTIPVDQTVTFVAGPPVASNPGNPGPFGGGGNGSGPGPSNPSDPNGPGKGYTYLTMTYNDVLADGVQTDTATAYITDAQGHPVANVAVVFTLHAGGPANGGALFQPQAEVQDTVYTNASGFAAMAISDTLPGDAWVDASVTIGGVLTVINGSSALAHFAPTADVNNPNTQLIVVVPEAVADGFSNTAVKAHVVDANGNPVVGASVTFAIDSGTAQIVTTMPELTDANGDATIYLSSTTVGDVLVTATVGGKPIIYGSPARVSFSGVNIYVPRAFSPNNDGTNDLLKPILVGIQTFHYFTVYNRWGNIVFTTTDPNQGWDGTMKGVPQPVETYLWIAEGIDATGKKIIARGMTSLVR